MIQAPDTFDAGYLRVVSRNQASCATELLRGISITSVVWSISLLDGLTAVDTNSLRITEPQGNFHAVADELVFGGPNVEHIPTRTRVPFRKAKEVEVLLLRFGNLLFWGLPAIGPDAVGMEVTAKPELAVGSIGARLTTIVEADVSRFGGEAVEILSAIGS